MEIGLTADLGSLAAGLAQTVSEIAPSLHSLHALGDTWLTCIASSRCKDAARLVAAAERLAGSPVDADDFTDRLAAYAEAIYR